MATDPICGMTVDERSAGGALARADATYYFCSSDCLNQFTARLGTFDRLRAAGQRTGEIDEVRGPVVDMRCDRLLPLHQALCANIDHETFLFEVHQHLDERHARLVTLNRTESPPPGSFRQARSCKAGRCNGVTRIA